MKKNKSEKKISMTTLGITAFISISCFFIFISIFFYGFSLRENPVVKKTVNIFPFPAAFGFEIDTISVKKLEKRKEAVANFYSNQDFSKLGYRIDFSGEEGRKKLKIKEKYLLEKLIEEEIVEKLSKERKIKINKDTIEETVGRKLNEYAAEEALSQNIKKLYGWDLEDFKENIVKPDLYKENLELFLKKNNESFLESKKTIEKAKEELLEGIDFSQVVQKYSQGESIKNFGDLGWFNRNQILSELSSIVFSLEKGETSEILQSYLGFHIIKVEDKKTENGIELVKIKQIFVRNKNFGDWLNEEKRNFKIYIPLKDFKWNQEKGIVEFTQKEMIDFEEETFKNPSGDPLFVF